MTSDPILIVNGDTLSDFALGPMLDRHEATRAAVTLAVVPNPAPDAYNGILVDTDDVVTGFVLKGLAARNWHFIGIQVARTAVYARLPDGVPADTIPTLYRSMLTDASGQVRAWRPTTDFVDVGTPRDYLEAALQTAAVEATGRPSDWHPESRESVVEAGARIDPSAVLERTVVWPEVEIGAGVVLENSIVAGPVRLPAGFRAEECVIVPAAAATPSDGVEVRDGAALFPL
jgi:mannose-1-phosphate guanylyltransferase